MERKNAWSQYSAEELSRLEAVNEDYKACLDAGKTERECVRLTIERIEKEGYKNRKRSSETVKKYRQEIRYTQYAWTRPSQCSIWEQSHWKRE